MTIFSQPHRPRLRLRHPASRIVVKKQEVTDLYHSYEVPPTGVLEAIECAAWTDFFRAGNLKSLDLNGATVLCVPDLPNPDLNRAIGLGSIVPATEQLLYGIELLVTEAAEDIVEKPNPSLHNLLRLGFREAYKRENYGSERFLG